MRTLNTVMILGLLTSLGPFAIGQQARDPVRVDDVNLSQNPIAPRYLAAEGADRATAWSDVRNGFKDLYVSVSSDFGMSWGPEFQTTSEATTGASNWDPVIVMENGVLHLLFMAMHSQTQRDLVYKRSTDMGQTWSTDYVLTSDVDRFAMKAHGDRVLIVWSEFSPDELFARWSTDGGQSFGTNQTVDPFNQGQYPVAEFDIAIVPFSGAGVVLYADDRAASRNLYLANGTPGTGLWGTLGRVDDDTLELGTPDDPRVVVQGLDLHMSWHENDRQGSNGKYSVYYRSYRGGVFQAEQRLGQSTYGVHTALNPEVVANENLVAVSWCDDRSGEFRPYVAVSQDDGATFQLDATLPERPSSGHVRFVDVAVDGNKIVLTAAEFHNNGFTVGDLPVATVSGDAGLSWSDPIDFEPTPFIPNVAAGMDALHFQDNMLTWVWGADRNGPREIHCGGIRFPVVEYQPVGGSAPKGILHLKYADSANSGQLARWAASTSIGRVVHPENPALFLDLAPSGIFNQSLAKANALTAVIRPDGSAQSNPIPIKPGLVGKRVFLQGWVNANGLGQPASEVLLATL